VMGFGWDRVSARVHYLATCLVALGATFSAVWIIVANSWQQTPAGFHVVQTALGPRAEITDFWAMVFNPSSVQRLVHTLVGAQILGSFFVMSVAAYYLLKGRHREFAEKSFTVALLVGLVVTVAAPITGHWQGVTVAATQPAKLAAMEGHFVTGTGPAPMHVFGHPDVAARRVRWGVAIPGLLSFLAHGNVHEPVTGLDRVPQRDWPPVGLTFHSFHLMVALGMLMLALTVVGAWWRWRGTLFGRRWLLWVFVLAVPVPYLANQLGWVAAEVGRQPWVVYGLLRTREAVSKSVSAGQVAGSIVMFLVIYALLFAVWLFVFDRKIRQGPEELAPSESTPPGGLLDVAGRRAGTGGGSLSDGKQGDG